MLLQFPHIIYTPRHLKRNRHWQEVSNGIRVDSIFAGGGRITVLIPRLDFIFAGEGRTTVLIPRLDSIFAGEGRITAPITRLDFPLW